MCGLEVLRGWGLWVLKAPLEPSSSGRLQRCRGSTASPSLPWEKIRQIPGAEPPSGTAGQGFEQRPRPPNHQICPVRAAGDPHHAVGVLSQPLQRQQGVVGLHHHVAHLVLVWENRVGLHQLLGVPGEKAQPPQGLTGPRQHSLLPQALFAVSGAQDSSESPAPHARVGSQGGNLSQQCLPQQHGSRLPDGATGKAEPSAG